MLRPENIISIQKTKRIFKTINLLILIILMLSCRSKKDIITEKITGEWAIENMLVNSKDYSKNLFVNFIAFDPDGKLSLPESYNYTKDHDAFWELKNMNGEDYLLILNSSDPAFAGQYEFNFILNNEKKILGIEISSKTTYIKAFKYYQNYNKLKNNWTE